MASNGQQATVDTDAVIIGAGFSGLYMLHKLRDQLGLSARVFEAADGVGGTWYWNRFPGARSDSESYIYCYTFDEDVWQNWEWSERYPGQREILSYLEHVARRFDLYRDITFSTRVTAAAFDEASGTWAVTTDSGETVTARYVIAASGVLSAANVPRLEEAAPFQGETYHTGHWPHEPVDFTGKRVGVIGTGASGVQAIPLIAQDASSLTVFQRTPSYVVPARNGSIPGDVREARKRDFAGIRERIRQARAGYEIYPSEKLASESTDEEVARTIQDRYDEGGFGLWFGTYADVFVSDDVNAKVREFLHDRIREKVQDPETAELLVPKGYPFGVKRTPLDSGYYETFNLEHVHLVDVRSNPVTRILPTGLQLAGGSTYELDVIVYATGFDAMTGPLNRIDIRGRDGRRLRDKWSQGPRTHLGLMSHGYPNLFFITGPQSPSVLSNMPVSIEQHVDFTGRVIGDLRDRGAATIEPTLEAEDSWVADTFKMADATLWSAADTWYTGANIPGKPRVFMPSLIGVGPYREHCDQIADNGYEGFTISGPPQYAGIAHKTGK
jgi:cation diffusion facilitator CzcD-associated flavoprotein CzcO